MAEDEMVGHCHQSYQHEFDPTPGGSGRQEGLVCSGAWGSQRIGHDLMTKQQQQQMMVSNYAVYGLLILLILSLNLFSIHLFLFYFMMFRSYLEHY